MTASVLPDPRTIGAVVLWTRQVLSQAGISDPAQETTWLLQHALGMKSHQLACEAQEALPPEAWRNVESLIARRVSREPLQYLLGTQDFCGLELAVSPAVLIPRPETELLIQEVVRDRVASRPEATIVDVGTGSGCLAITVATILADVRVLAIDRSADALAVAMSNGSAHGVQDKIKWLQGDLLEPLREQVPPAAVDIILSNPPYIAEADWAHLQPEVRLFEPRMALVGGPTGTEFHERLLEDSRGFLSPGGLLLMEIGQGQAAAVRQIAKRVGGYGDLTVVGDAGGIERIVKAHRLI
jgi:release factor glutamine methyltransferase